MNINVLKKGGSTEPFYKDKITRVITAAGLNPQESGTLSETINQWAQSQQDPIPTNQIRNKVLEELQKINPHVADVFIWYEKSKETSSDTGPKDLNP